MKDLLKVAHPPTEISDLRESLSLVKLSPHQAPLAKGSTRWPFSYCKYFQLITREGMADILPTPHCFFNETGNSLWQLTSPKNFRTQPDVILHGKTQPYIWSRLDVPSCLSQCPHTKPDSSLNLLCGNNNKKSIGECNQNGTGMKNPVLHKGLELWSGRLSCHLWYWHPIARY